jgi:hypothetical protein
MHQMENKLFYIFINLFKVLPDSLQIFLAGMRFSCPRWQYYVTAFRSFWQLIGLALPDGINT